MSIANNQPVIVPPLFITQGLPFFQEFQFRDVDGPIDFTGWSGVFTLAAKPFDAPFYEAPLDLDDDGVIRVAIEGSVTEAFPAPARIGGGPAACYQIALTAPLEDFNQLWQGTANIAGRF